MHGGQLKGRGPLFSIESDIHSLKTMKPEVMGSLERGQFSQFLTLYRGNMSLPGMQGSTSWDFFYEKIACYGLNGKGFT